MQFATRANDNNSNNNGHEYIPACIHLLPHDGKLDAENNPIRQTEVIEDPKKFEALFDRLNMDPRFITSEKRFHGGQRQMLYGLHQVVSGTDRDSRKRGGDKLKKYAGILRKTGREVIDWRAMPNEAFCFEVTKRQFDGTAKYVGWCVFTEDNDEGRDLIRRLEVGVEDRRSKQPFIRAEEPKQHPANIEAEAPKDTGEVVLERRRAQDESGWVNTPTISPHRRRKNDMRPVSVGFPLRGTDTVTSGAYARGAVQAAHED